MRWAFVDESVRPGRMVVAAVVTRPGDVRVVRAAMRTLLLPGQRRLHLTDERPARRHQILDQVARQPLVAVVATGTTHSRRHAVVRHELLTDLVERLVALDARRIVLDRMPEELLEVDRSTIAAALDGVGREDVVYDHAGSTSDPMLWAADAVAWGTGAGGHDAERLNRILQAP